ncbi:hypothetical protein [Candidatus Avelusimicrobium aviculae]|uniref:hypothetical protein n=1 Tax=Candidatus Avelusimicrobium aviculae TaxID=3416206 RepID=UPI003D0F6E0A
MFIKNNKGAALMQVLLVTVVLAGMAAMLLRATLSRTITARHTRRSVSTQLMVDSCMAEVNSLWASKSPEAFLGDFNGDGRGAFMYCDDYDETTGICSSTGNAIHRYYDCSYQIDNVSYTVRAWLYDNASPDSSYPKEDFTGKEEDGKLQMVFEVLNSEGASL